MARFVAVWRALLVASEMRAGCSVVAVTVAAGDDDLLSHAGAIFRAWRAQMASLLVQGGIAPERADGMAALVISACEGAVAVVRAERDMVALDLVEGELLGMIEPRA